MKQLFGPQADKKPYQPPKLLVYGNLTEMTQAIGKKGAPDGGTKPNKQRTGH